MKKTLLCSALLAALMSVSGGAQAALVSQGTGLVLDNVNNLLWYVAETSSDYNYLDWNGTMGWASGLTAGGLSAGSWSLATNSQFGLLAAAASGSNSAQKNASLNALGIDDGGFWGQDQTTVYDYDDSPLDGAYFWLNFDFYQVATGQEIYMSIDQRIAVTTYSAPAPSAVPIPAAAWLMASGLGALGVAARKRKAQQA